MYKIIKKCNYNVTDENIPNDIKKLYKYHSINEKQIKVTRSLHTLYGFQNLNMCLCQGVPLAGALATDT